MMAEDKPQVLHTDYHIGENEEVLRLFSTRNATTCCAYLLPTLLQHRPTFKLLDVGCGPGSITFDLARMFPQATIIGVDQSANVIARNQELVAQSTGSFPNISFRTGNILEPEAFVSPEEFGTFDVVHEHATLIHIPDGAAALRQMRRLAKTDGGIVASRNGDLRAQILQPPCPLVQALIEALYDLNGADVETGRKVVGMALEAGWLRAQITASASVMKNATAEERRVYAESMLANLRDPDSEMRKSMKRLPNFGDASLPLLFAELERFIAADSGWRLLICCEVICRNE